MMNQFLIDHARDFAVQMHRGQLYGKKDYVSHLEDVVRTLNVVGADYATICAGWLHDVLEDTPIGVDILEKEFGPEITSIVVAVTDKPGRNRRERQEKTYPAIKDNEKALIVKLADRIANTENSKHQGGSYWNMYEKEYSFFRGILYSPEVNGIAKRLWKHLDSLYAHTPAPAHTPAQEQ